MRSRLRSRQDSHPHGREHRQTQNLTQDILAGQTAQPGQTPQQGETMPTSSPMREEQTPDFAPQNDDPQDLRALLSDMSSIPLGRTKQEMLSAEDKLRNLTAKVEPKRSAADDKKGSVLDGLKQAAQTGAFDLRGWIGQRFQRDHKSGTDKHSEYAKIGARQEQQNMPWHN